MDLAGNSVVEKEPYDTRPLSSAVKATSAPLLPLLQS